MDACAKTKICVSIYLFIDSILKLYIYGALWGNRYRTMDLCAPCVSSQCVHACDSYHLKTSAKTRQRRGWRGQVHRSCRREKKGGGWRSTCALLCMFAVGHTVVLCLIETPALKPRCRPPYPPLPPHPVGACASACGAL